MSLTTYLVKSPHQKTKFTKKQINELHDCALDPVYFMEKFVKVQHPTKGEVPFILHEYQKGLIDVYLRNRFSIAKMPRQSGKSTCAASFLLWKAMFFPDQTILISANIHKQAKEIMQRVRYAYEGLPDHIRAGAVTYNKESIEFDNGSRILATATTENTGRGMSISLLYLDEFAFVKPNIAREFWSSISPTISTGGSCIITSTPSTDVDQFAEIWRESLDTLDEHGNEHPQGLGKNSFKSFTAHWSEHPDRDEEWANIERGKIGDEQFRREFGCEFISYDETLISPLFLKNMVGQDELFRLGEVRFYKPINPKYTYVVALDPASGTTIDTKGDYAAITVWEIQTLEQVAEWKHNRTPIPGQMSIMLQILRYIRNEIKKNPRANPDAQIYWSLEANSGYGQFCWQIVLDTGEDHFPGEFVRELATRGRTRRPPGLNTTKTSKQFACVKLKSLIESGRMKVYSKSLIYELKFFVRRAMSYEAKSGEHDDVVSSVLIAVRMLEIIKRWDNTFDNKIAELLEDEQSLIEPMPISFLTTF